MIKHTQLALLTGVMALLLCGCPEQQQAQAVPPALTSTNSKLSAVWVNNGADKVARSELRVSRKQADVRNSLWNGRRVALFGARNEVVSFNLVLESLDQEVANVEVSLSPLRHASGAEITSRPARPSDLFDYRGRNLELFYVRYLQIKGLSKMAYESYDERHIPARLRRPFRGEGAGKGKWTDRPDHDKFYPDIAIPLELHSPFTVEPETNQSIWADCYIPHESPAGSYQGEIQITENSVVTWTIPVELTVRDFTLPDLPAARTMLYVSDENINKRNLGKAYPRDSGSFEVVKRSNELIDRHYQLAHRHKISLIQNHQPLVQMGTIAKRRLTGELFTAEHGYEGIGEGVGNNVLSIGTYGGWPWKKGGKEDMWRETDKWARWIGSQKFDTPTESFLYLIDESTDYAQIEQWAKWVSENPGPGGHIPTFATLAAPEAVEHTPSLSIAASWFSAGATKPWEQAAQALKEAPDHQLFMYNGIRPGTGSFSIDDDGVALRQLSWAQYKMGIGRWFQWEGTYYDNYQAGLGETNVFQQAHTFGKGDRQDPVLGQTGWNFSNGDGVLIYPGTDAEFPEESYGVAGPIASLRLKHWRRGIQDVDYLTMAAKVDPQRVASLVQRMIPRVLWEVGVTDPSDPTWVQADISWSTDPDVWEAARSELAAIIEQRADQPSGQKGAK